MRRSKLKKTTDVVGSADDDADTMTMIANRNSSWCRIRFVAAALLAFSLVSSVALLNPRMPESGLDASWSTIANVATANRLAFGKDLINTFGPYNALFSRTYDPDIDTLMVTASLLLMLAYYFLALLAFVDRNGTHYLLAAVFFALASIDQNSIFFAFPMLFAIAIQRLQGLNECPHTAWQQHAVSTGTVLAGAIGNGMLGLSKASMIPYSLVMMMICAAWLAAKREHLLATSVFVSYLIVTALLWVVPGQSLSNLPYYYLSVIGVVSGYGDAMSYPGPALQWLIYLLVAAATVFMLAIDRARPLQTRIFLGIIVITSYFFSFKAGFVRHDGLVHSGFPIFFSGHAATAALTLMLVGLISPVFVGSKARQAVCGLMGVSGCALIISFYGPVNPIVAGRHIVAVQASALDGIRSRLSFEKTLESQYNERIARIRKELDIPHIDGSFDIYSFDQAYLLAHQLKWQPRPVSQSFAAYAPELLRINFNHLEGPSAPDNIVFKVQTIDGRYPSLDDGPSWQLLMHRYTPTKRLKHDFLLLGRKELQHSSASAFSPPTYFASKPVHLGQRVLLPAGESIRYARFRFRKTTAGRILSIAYKTPILVMQVELADGSKSVYRIIPGMTETGFLLSPLIDSTDKFAFAATRQTRVLAPSRVIAFTLAAAEGGALSWHDTVEYSLSAPY